MDIRHLINENIVLPFIIATYGIKKVCKTSVKLHLTVIESRTGDFERRCLMPGYRSSSKDALCFCEYENIKGEKSHLLATLCDCDAVDTVCDKFLTCQSVPDEKIDLMFSTIEDRCRLPWCGGKGALRVPLDVAFPVVTIPCAMILASVGAFCTKFVLISLPLLLFMFYRNWIRRPNRKRTKLFFVWGLMSAIQMYFTYVTVVIGFREVLLWETMLLTTMFGVMLFALFQVKKNPGVIHPTTQVDLAEKKHELENRPSEFEVTWVDSRPIKDGVLDAWCNSCNVHKPPRSGHCLICNSCIRNRDHHCVWIDSCVGLHNHRAFLVALLLCILTGFYGAHLTMTTVCTPEIYFEWLLWPSDCRFVYMDFPTGLSFASACYTYISIVGLTILLIQQLIYISQNITAQEWHMARFRGWTRFFFVARNNVNNRGFLHNWLEFIFEERRQRYLNILSSV